MDFQVGRGDADNGSTVCNHKKSEGSGADGQDVKSSVKDKSRNVLFRQRCLVNRKPEISELQNFNVIEYAKSKYIIPDIFGGKHGDAVNFPVFGNEATAAGILRGGFKNTQSSGRADKGGGIVHDRSGFFDKAFQFNDILKGESIRRYL
ncbi:hypothetical protein Barb4_04076 [Bacteroidales bacterium Barb4]|nr:hypothetical protein Barb4_04076 [Bacteroidales bacterium Barb4]